MKTVKPSLLLFTFSLSRKITCLLISLILVMGMISSSAAAAKAEEPKTVTISGKITLPDIGIGPYTMRLRVEGTNITRDIRESGGNFTLENVPVGNYNLVIDEQAGRDDYQKILKVIPVKVQKTGLSNLNITLAQKWKDIPNTKNTPHEIEKVSGYFLSDKIGWILWKDSVSKPQKRFITKTEDGGITWKTIAEFKIPDNGIPYPNKRLLFMPDGLHGFAGSEGGGYGNGVYYTEDGGKSWTLSALPDPFPTAAAYSVADEIVGISPTNLLAIGSSSYMYGSNAFENRGMIWESKDAGKTWEIANISDQNPTALGAAPNGQAVAFITPFGQNWGKRLYRNPSDGKWTTVECNEWSVNKGYATTFIAFASGAFYANGTKGIMKSSDGGVSWTRISDFPGGNVYVFNDDKAFLAAGNAFVSYDGTRNWYPELSKGCDEMFIFNAHSLIMRSESYMRYTDPSVINYEVLGSSSMVGSKDAAADLKDISYLNLNYVNRGTENIQLNKITLRILSKFPDFSSMTVKLFDDLNYNGIKDSNEEIIGSGTFAKNSKALTITPKAIDLKEGRHKFIGALISLSNSTLLGKPFELFTNSTADTIGTVKGNSYHPQAPVGVTVTTGSIAINDITPPGWPAGSKLTVRDTNSFSVVLNWSKATDNTAVSGYWVFKDNVKFTFVSGKAKGIYVSGLSPKTSYSFKVAARDNEGNWTNTLQTATVSTTASPSVPQNLKDKTRPVAKITDAAAKNSLCQLKGTISDNDKNLRFVRIYQNVNDEGEFLAASGKFLNEFAFNNIELYHGNNRFRLEVSDVSGNTTTIWDNDITKNISIP